jgi:hypothetical protein
MAQITTRLSTKIRAAFDRYAKSVGLDASELARLLIIRELHVRRILQSTESISGVAPKNRKDRAERKLTAHFHSAAVVVELDNYSSAHGYTRSDAAKRIFEQELSEKWLLNAFRWNPLANGSA